MYMCKYIYIHIYIYIFTHNTHTCIHIYKEPHLARGLVLSEQAVEQRGARVA